MIERRFERIPITVPLLISASRTLFQKRIEIQCRNISGGGFAFETGKSILLRPDDRVVVSKLRNLPDSAQIEGRVVYRIKNPKTGCHTVGVEFKKFVNTSQHELVERIHHWKQIKPVLDFPNYNYFYRSKGSLKLNNKRKAVQRSHRILNPKLRDIDFLVLRERRRLFSQWVQSLPERGLQVVDIGGRLQPYRPLIEDRLKLYIAIDPILEGLLDVLAVGENLPFRGETFHLALCTQVLNYTAEPSRVIAEIHRLLKPGGYLFLSVPAIFPRYHDQRWRFMPEGLITLLSPFSEIQIVPEGYSVSGLFRLLNLFLNTSVHLWRGRRLIESTVFTVMNTAGGMLDKLSRGNSRFSTNYSCRARK